jgi:DivIVA domain-containing protein
MVLVNEIVGWLCVIGGTVKVATMSFLLVRARQGGAPLHAVSVTTRSELLAGAASLAVGVVCLTYGLTIAAANAFVFALLIAWLSMVPAPRFVRHMKVQRVQVAPAPHSAFPAGLDDATLGIIRRIKDVRFMTTGLRPGYDEKEVDTFLDRLIADVTVGGRLDRDELHSVQFTRTRLRPGYTLEAVDSFLADVASRSS